MKQFQENVWAEGRMERQMDRQTLFHRDEMLKCGRNWFGKSENIIATINSCICCIPCYIKSSGIIRELATVPCKDKKPIDICILWRDSAIRDRSYLQN